MTPAQPVALQAKLYIRHSQSTDVLTEMGRQVNNGNLNKSAAYLSDGAPRMGFSREPADFAFASYVKTKSGDVDSTKGKNVLQAMAQAGGVTGNSVASSNQNSNKVQPADNGDNLMAARNNSVAETSKGGTLNVAA